MPRKTAGVHVIDTISAIHTQLALLTKKFDATNVSTIQIQNPPYDAFVAGQQTNEGQVGNFGFPLTEQAIYYLSRTMIGAEHQYNPIEKECLALVFAVQKMRHYLVSLIGSEKCIFIMIFTITFSYLFI